MTAYFFGRRGLLQFGAAAALCAPALRPVRAETPLRIGIQKYGSLYLLRARGELDAVLQPLGYAPVWKEFPGGPQLLEALNVGALDYGHTGEAPPIFAQAAGAPLVYVGAHPSAPKAEAILVPQASPITTVEQLAGKRVALNRGSNVHYLLVQALARAGLKLQDIATVFLPPADARAAFERGSVDAWVIWDPFFAAAADARVVTDATGLAPNREFHLADRKFAESRPDAVRAILAAVARTDEWAKDHVPEAARLMAPSMGLSVPVTELALARRGFGLGPITPEILAGQQKIADTFHQLRLIPAAIDVSAAAWKAQA